MRRAEPDWAALAREMKRPGVTMTILWEEYRETQSGGYGYSRFCDLLRGFERRLTPVMRQHHVAGDKAFVDYSGKRIGIADPTGEIREAEIFVKRARRLEPHLTPRRPGRKACPTGRAPTLRMFRFFGGAPRRGIPDYVPGNVIGIKRPNLLCAGPPGNPFSPRRFGLISIRAMKAIRGVLVTPKPWARG